MFADIKSVTTDGTEFYAEGQPRNAIGTALGSGVRSAVGLSDEPREKYTRWERSYAPRSRYRTSIHLIIRTPGLRPPR